MTVTVGIDLGTTNSCIAVHARAEIPRRDELIRQGALVEVGNALVVADPPRTGVMTPSAVWIGADGEVVVGLAAKQLGETAGEPPPATMFKRSMGWQTTVRAGHAELTPVEASAHVLRHLRETAERVLGVPVEQAIVTVPAHFETTAKTATADAAEQAGLRVVETLFEPVAGALAYADQGIGGDGTGVGTFLVYDLGGGTFDVSVVSWSDDGLFDLRATAGDRYLGGVEFDRALMALVVEEAVGVDLAFDDEDPVQAAARARLLARAELTKIELTSSTQAWLVDQGARDRHGNLAHLRVPVQRARFEEAVAATVEQTLTTTAEVVASLPLAASDVDEVVLVGGSTRVPLVKRLLAERWSRVPRELDPDLCVVAGAALRTASVDDTTEHLEVARPVVADGTVDVAGRVRAGGVLDSAAGCLLTLAADDGSVARRTHSGPDGRFAFDEVPVDEAGTDLVLTLVHGGGALDVHRFSVTADRPVVPDVDPLLARTFSLLTKQGRLEVVPGGQTKVPHRAHVTSLGTVGRGSTLVVPVFEGDVHVQDLRISGLPADLPPDTPVEVELTFAADWTIDAVVTVPSVGAQGEATWSVTHREVDPWDVLVHRFSELAAGWEERRPQLTVAERLTHGPAIEKLIAEIRELMARRDDLVKANARVEALATRLPALPVPVLLEPPASEFETVLDRLASACDELERTDADRAAAFRADIPNLRRQGYAAWRREDQHEWTKVVEAVRAQCLAVDRRLSPSTGPVAPPDPRPMATGMFEDLGEGSRQVRRRDAETGGRHHDEAERLLAEAERLEREVLGVDPESPDAVTRLRRIDDVGLAPWQAKVKAFPPDGEVGVRFLGPDRHRS